MNDWINLMGSRDVSNTTHHYHFTLRSIFISYSVSLPQAGYRSPSTIGGFFAGEITPDAHWIRPQSESRRNGEKKICCPCQESNPDPSVVHPAVSWPGRGCDDSSSSLYGPTVSFFKGGDEHFDPTEACHFLVRWVTISSTRPALYRRTSSRRV